MDVLPYAVAVWLFVVGLFGIVTSRHLVHLTMCLAVLQSSTYVLLLAIGYRRGGTAPIFEDIPVGRKAVDPVAHALTFVDIVVEAVVVALLLGIAVQVERRFGSLDPEELHPLRG